MHMIMRPSEPFGSRDVGRRWTKIQHDPMTPQFPGMIMGKWNPSEDSKFNLLPWLTLHLNDHTNLLCHYSDGCLVRLGQSPPYLRAQSQTGAAIKIQSLKT